MPLFVERLAALGPMPHALIPLARAALLGGVLFLVCVLRPLGWTLGGPGARMRRDGARIVACAAIVLALCVGLTLAPTDPPQVPDALLGGYAEAGVGLLIVVLLAVGWAPGVVLLALGAVGLAAATYTAPVAALDPRAPLYALVALHQLGAALWLGSLPAFVAALARVRDGQGWRTMATRFCGMSAVGVVAVAVSGIGLAVFTATGAAGDPGALYGTRYGVLLGAKTMLSLGLLALQAGLWLVVARVRGRTPVARLKRFAEVEIAIGLAVVLIAGALAALPRPISRTQDRLAWSDIVARERPAPPRIDGVADAPRAIAAWFDDTPRRAGVAISAIGLLALLHRAGLRGARHWPVLVVALGAALLLYADPPLWTAGGLDSLRDPALLWRRGAGALLVVAGLIEWRERGFGRGRRDVALLLPLALAVAGVALLLRAPADLPAPRQALAAFVDAPLAVLAIAAGAARWLELRLEPYEGHWAGWLWAGCATLGGLLLLDYPAA